MNVLRCLVVMSGLVYFGGMCSLPAPMEVHSSVFSSGQMIPRNYTGQGKDLSPALTWSGAPLNTKSFVVICDDPDAPRKTWVHWVLTNIEPTIQHLEEGTSKGTRGYNSWDTVGYKGPMPPAGKEHRYFFKVYALDTVLPNKAMHKQEVMRAMDGHILAQAELMGLYKRGVGN